jgi:[ribosomal protein S18]-alanine N-acetyltransferase
MNAVMNNCQIRWMIRRDTERVMEIENERPHPWDIETLIDCLRSRECIGMVAEQTVSSKHYSQDLICGFMVYELRPRRIQLLKLGVADDFRLGGIGRAMLEKLKTKLEDRRRCELRAFVRETNLDGQLFLRSCGMKATRIVEDLYDTGEHAYDFVYRRSECHGA